MIRVIDKNGKDSPALDGSAVAKKSYGRPSAKKKQVLAKLILGEINFVNKWLVCNWFLEF